MNRTVRLALVGLGLSFVIGLAACGGSKQQVQPAPQPAPAVQPAPTTPAHGGCQTDADCGGKRCRGGQCR